MVIDIFRLETRKKNKETKYLYFLESYIHIYFFVLRAFEMDISYFCSKKKRETDIPTIISINFG